MLLKNEEHTTNVIYLTKRKLMDVAYGAECLSSKIDNWILNNNNNYRKLRTSKLAKSCLTMLDHPLLPTKSSNSSFEDEFGLESTDECAFENPLYDETSVNICDTNISCEDLKKKIVNPTIKMDGDVIEIEYYCENIDFSEYRRDEIIKSCSLEENSLETNTQHTSGTKTLNVNTNFPKIPQYKIADNRGLSPQHCPNYKDFLIRCEDENTNSNNNNNQENKQENRNDNIIYFQELNPKTLNQFDKHRQLKQSIHKQQHNLSDQSPMTFQRSGSARINKDVKPELKSFLSFRCPNKTNKPERRVRKKYVVSEDDGTVWPAVLLTYDKKITTGPSERTANNGCFNWNAVAPPENL